MGLEKSILEDGSIETAKRDLAIAHRIFAFENMHEGTWNHLSVLVPDDATKILVTPGNRHFSDIHAQDLLTMDKEGVVVEGASEPNSAAWCLHYPIHEARSDAVCIIHLHSTYSTALMMQKDKVLDERSSQAAAVLYNQIAYYDVYDGVLSEPEEGAAMAAVLGNKTVLALRNHGFITVGDTVGKAVDRAYTFERACQLQLLAESSGNQLCQIPQNMIEDICAEENKDLGDYFVGMSSYIEKRGL